MLSQLRVGQSNWYYSYPVAGAGFLSIIVPELDSCRPIPENTDRISFSTMKDDYGEVCSAFKGRGLLSQLRIGLSKSLSGSSGLISVFCLTCGDADDLN
jgi:hypothetical protein